MENEKLRQLEKQHKLRVKTGCATCRARRVKCDETKPHCLRCTKTGRQCDGYKHISKARSGSPAAAASFRNSHFLVVPSRPGSGPSSIASNPSRSLSPEAKENRAFFYFQTHALPKWTELFESDLWSEKILQLCHHEPAIKHGVLALSTMHEDFETCATFPTSRTTDFAFVQYMEAVRHSNELLTEHRKGKVDHEKVLLACILFTCYENLAGNYRAANMHMLNGLRILRQHAQGTRAISSMTSHTQDSVAHVLYRFDLQAMTFSDNTSPYVYSLEDPPRMQRIPEVYKNNIDARNDLVNLYRALMWISGIANVHQHAPEDSTWLRIYTQLMASWQPWERAFEAYQQNLSLPERSDLKVYAGNTLLKMYCMLARIVIGAGAGMRSQMVFDPFEDSFRTIIDMAETLPLISSTAPASRGTSTSPSSSFDTPSPPHLVAKTRAIAPHPSSSIQAPSPSSSGHAAFSIRSMPAAAAQSSPSAVPFRQDTPPALQAANWAQGKRASVAASPSSDPSPALRSRAKPCFFSPSFELSPSVLLFVIACRCRDPVLRRRAIALLLHANRREGVWDSVGAARVALQIVKLEEGLDAGVEPEPGTNWLPLHLKCAISGDVPEKRRVQDVFTSVSVRDRRIGASFLLAGGEAVDRVVHF